MGIIVNYSTTQSLLPTPITMLCYTSGDDCAVATGGSDAGSAAECMASRRKANVLCMAQIARNVTDDSDGYSKKRRS
jgi:hypothetical protein